MKEHKLLSKMKAHSFKKG